MGIRIALFIIFVLQNFLLTAQNTSNVLTLNECIAKAEENNVHVKILEEELKIAKTREAQTESALWPSLDMTASAFTLDENPNFIIPDFPINLPSMRFGEINVPPLTLSLPSQIVKLADKQFVKADFSFRYPLFTGGKISSILNQAESAVSLAQTDTDEAKNYVRYQVRKTFYGAQLASKLVEIIKETTSRLKVTLELTESLYLNGSGTVTKIDYLNNKFIVENALSYLKSFDENKQTAYRGLEYYTGLTIGTDVDLTETYHSPSYALTQSYASIFNLEQINFGYLRLSTIENIFSAKIDEMRSGFYPNLALIGNYSYTFNNYDYGFVTPQNKSQWMIGLGLQFPVFNGFLTSNRVLEAELQLSKFQLQKGQYHDAIILQTDMLLIKIKSTIDEIEILEEAARTAGENRDLSERAYSNDMLETEKLIQSQLLESYAKINLHYKKYELNILFSDLDYILCK